MVNIMTKFQSPYTILEPHRFSGLIASNDRMPETPLLVEKNKRILAQAFII